MFQSRVIHLFKRYRPILTERQYSKTQKSELTRISSVFNIVKNTDSLKILNEPYIMTLKVKENNNNSFELQKQKIIQG